MTKDEQIKRINQARKSLSEARMTFGDEKMENRKKEIDSIDTDLKALSERLTEGNYEPAFSRLHDIYNKIGLIQPPENPSWIKQLNYDQYKLENLIARTSVLFHDLSNMADWNRGEGYVQVKDTILHLLNDLSKLQPDIVRSRVVQEIGVIERVVHFLWLMCSDKPKNAENPVEGLTKLFPGLDDVFERDTQKIFKERNDIIHCRNTSDISEQPWIYRMLSACRLLWWILAMDSALGAVVSGCESYSSMVKEEVQKSKASEEQKQKELAKMRDELATTQKELGTKQKEIEKVKHQLKEAQDELSLMRRQLQDSSAKGVIKRVWSKIAKPFQ